MTTYTTKQGDILDDVLYRYYGHSKNLESVLEANHTSALAAHGPVLPGGLIIVLPPEPEQPAQTPTNRLWD